MSSKFYIFYEYTINVVNTVFILVCPQSFTLVNNSCYHFKFAHVASWQAAKDHCISLGARLAVIETAEEMFDISTHLLSCKISHY